MTRQPVLFLSHESPTMWDTPSPARQFIQSLGIRLPTPQAVLVVSAHWQERQFKLASSSAPATIHDFGGFPDHYYDIRYPAPGHPEVAAEAHKLLMNQGISTELDADRGMDHAVWLPVGLMYPKADIPIVSLSIKLRGREVDHLKVGEALAPLRDQGVLMIGSGTATHNLGAFFSGTPPQLDGEPDEKAVEFSRWLIDKANDPQEILGYRKRAPHAATCHPTPDHFLPFIVAMGAGKGDEATCIHDSFSYSHFAMTCMAWGMV